ncbi:MAG TPA: hypothetical protein VMS31_14540 [Pyrinomonadaceae bacterium]|nr:hypothetical protein [Pyrinomonadaceae bacterium]
MLDAGDEEQMLDAGCWWENRCCADPGSAQAGRMLQTAANIW